jgi:uncharacterized protein with ParB-like and HNH nuclease domain
MPYQEETIKTILDRVNKQYFLPSIQRNYVWGPERVIMLFDSILRGYPISSFLFWELEHENRDRWEIYKFCEAAYSGGTEHDPLHAAVGISSTTLVLDGQQRLTSILIGLKGIYCIKPARWRKIRENYPKCRLYMDLFATADPEEDDEEFTGKPYYTFSWKPENPGHDDQEYWFQVGKILDCKNDNEFYKLKDKLESTFSEKITKVQENVFERNLMKLYQAIWKDATISYYVERDQDYDRVLDIFVRANEAGITLTKAEIIFSMLDSKWEKGAKSKIESLINKVNEQLTRKNNINLEFVMRCCLVLTDLPVRYRINTFTTKNIDLIEKKWPEIENAIIRTMKLINRFGFDRNTISGLNVLVPLVLYLYNNPKIDLMGTTAFETRNARLIRRWIILAIFNRVFGRGVENVLSNLRKIIKYSTSKESDFPIEKLNDEIKRMGFSTELNDQAINEYLASEYPVQFLKLSLLYDEHFWDVSDVQQDHIFPQALFKSSNPEFTALPKEKQELFRSLENRAANIQPLMDDENNEKRAQSFEKWLITRDVSFRKIHLIPNDDELLQFKNFDKFIAARENLITKKLLSVF